MRAYLDRYKTQFFWVGLFAFLIHGSKLNSVIIGIDTEDLIHLQEAFYGGWLNTGRQGLVLLKYLTGSAVFNPYFAGAETLVFLTLGTVAFLLLWDRVSGAGSKPAWVGCALLWIAHPVLVEQFYFTLQSAEICAGILLTAIALWLVYEAGERGRFLGYLYSGLLLLISFSVYQIFVVLFIFGTVTVLLLQTLKEDGEGSVELPADRSERLHPGQRGGQPRKLSGMLRQMCPYVGVFLAAFLCNSLITKLFFSESNYLSSQVKWGSLSLRNCIYKIAIHVRDVLTGQNSIFYSWVFGALFLLGLVEVFFLLKRHGFRLLFYYVSLMTTPFLMTVVCADVPAVRSQLVLPALTGFLVYLDALLAVRVRSACSGSESGLRKGLLCPMVILVLLCVAGGVAEVQMSLRLYYTDACRYAQDEAFARELIGKLEPLIGEDETPVVVLGSREFQPNHACVRGEMIGHSVFEHDVEEEPRFYWSTRRVIGFLHTLGYDCEQLPDKNIPYAIDFAEDMDVWPGEHSVEHAGDMIVIKLSEIE